MPKINNHEGLMAQIAKLQNKAETIRLKDKSVAVDGIKKQMLQYGISLADLQIGGSSKIVAPKVVKGNKTVLKETQVVNLASAVKATRRKPEPKYQDPKTGTTWSGRGKTPKWMQSAILKGKSKEKFAIR
jgi:DNA-binding protein H-NS